MRHRLRRLASSAAATVGLVGAPAVLVGAPAVPAAPPVLAAPAVLAAGGSPAAAGLQLSPASFSLKWSAGPFADTGEPIAEGSPMVATLDASGPSVVVGDRAGHLYAFHIADGTPVAGWPVDAGAPVDSTPSVAATPSGAEVFVGTGNAYFPNSGGYQAFAADGARLWSQRIADPVTDYAPSAGVQASLAVATLQGQTAVFAGALGQMSSALSATTGVPLKGWPFFSADSTFSTAATADLYGTGQTELVVGGASTAGLALGQTYPQGGHLRILNSEGGLICHYDTDQEVDSSPAVGAFLAGGATGIVTGTGQYWPGAADTDTVEAFDTKCHRVWSTRLDGVTSSSPALADVLGDGALQVVEGTDLGPGGGGSVWVLDAASGRPLWHTAVSGRVIGSVVTADLTGGGYQDLVVPTTFGTDIVDGRSGAVVAVLSPAGFQNAPLVTDDPDGSIGITIAGYDGNNDGVVYHYEIAGSNGAEAVGAGSWPMFHHDPQLSGVAGAPPLAPVPACEVPVAAGPGYHLVASDGGVFSFGPPFCGSTGGVRLNQPVVGGAVAPSTGGYWMVARDGGVFSFGGASFHGSTGNVALHQPMVGMAATPDGQGYWLVAADGGVFAFGDAGFDGSAGSYSLTRPAVGMAATADGRGYWIATADGGVFTFGDAVFQGSAGSAHLRVPVVAMAEDPATGGYWLVGADGGVFAFGAPFFGSTGGLTLNSPIVGITPTEDGGGYWLVAADGGVFAFGDARFHGSTGGVALNRPVVALLGTEG
ncbi:MAG: PQQ-binding-like beta-propeller repeat protein [Acidobacteriota bacterium]|nr:PQQ-binding-like beta-propeller repeat protein [Acidobacteriota bacterium]